jgi:predicted MPP superfamily phosphohydrolase
MTEAATDSDEFAIPPERRRRTRRFALRVLQILAPAHIYVGWSLLPDLPGPDIYKIAGGLWLLVSVLIIPYGTLARVFIHRPGLIDALVWAGSLAMGWFSSLLVATLLRDLVTLLPPLRGYDGESALAVLAVSLLVTMVGFVNARRVAEVVRVRVPVVNLPAVLEGFTLAQITDIHVGSTIKGDYVRGIVERVNGLGADAVAITGDVIDGRVDRLAGDVAPLGDLKSRHGTFLVTGNHEYYSGAPAWLAHFRGLGIRTLENAYAVIEHDGEKLVIAGINDFSAGGFDADAASDPAKALAGAPTDAPRVVLAHQPRSAQAVDEAGADLQLSGHTHGGQFWPWNHFVRMQQPYTAGLHRHGNLWVYTSRGTGYWGPPKRFFAPSEITLITLARAD